MIFKNENEMFSEILDIIQCEKLNTVLSALLKALAFIIHQEKFDLMETKLIFSELQELIDFLKNKDAKN